MKKIILGVIIMIISLLASAQLRPYEIRNKQFQLNWGADSVYEKIGTSLIEFGTTKKGYSFSKSLTVADTLHYNILWPAIVGSGEWTLVGDLLTPNAEHDFNVTHDKLTIYLDTSTVYLLRNDNATNQSLIGLNKQTLLLERDVNGKINHFQFADSGMSILLNTHPVLSADSGANHLKIYTDTRVSGDLTVTGDLTYEFPHAVAVRDSAPQGFPNVARWVWTKVIGFTTIEVDDITLAGDTITIQKAGDYELLINFCITGEPSHEYKFQLFKNGLKVLQGARISGPASGDYRTFTWYWYIAGAAVGDRFSIRYQNQTANNKPITLYEGKMNVKKIPE